MFGVEDPATEGAVRAYVKLLRATRSMVARTTPGLAAAGVTTTQLGVLEAVLHLGPLTQRELTRKLLTSPGNLTDVIDKLARRGLVRRMACPEDRRSVRVELTDEGREFIGRLFPRHAKDIACAMSGLSDEEIGQLDRLLRKLGVSADDED